MRMKAFWTIPCLVVLISACTQETDAEHKQAYEAGYADASVKLKNVYERRVQEMEATHRREVEVLKSQIPGPSLTQSTEICGVDGANVNGRHIDGGKTGCVRMYSDGRYERF